MISLKTRIITFITASTLLLCACGKLEPSTPPPATPKEAAECVLESIKKLDMETLNQYTDNYVETYHNWLGVPIENEYRIFNELLQPRSKHNKRYQSAYKLDQKIMAYLTWEITDVQTDEDTAALDMVLTNIDMAKVLEIYESQLLENMLIGIIDDVASDLESGGLISIRVTVYAYQENGQWKIHLSHDFINAFSGNMYTDAYTENLEEKAAELDKQFEKKWENWLE